MDKIDFEGFLVKNKVLLTVGIVAIVILIGSIFAYRYYEFRMNTSANTLLWKGIKSYMSLNGKNQKMSAESSIVYLKKIKSKYKGTNAYKIANFYLGLDYRKIGKLNKSIVYLSEYTKMYPKPNSSNLSYLAYSNMADIAMIEKNYKNAVKYFSEMTKIDSIRLQEHALLREAYLYTQIKEQKKAIAIYKAILTNDAITKDRGYIENLIQLNSYKLKKQ